jgi:hypothetical protein
LFPICKVYPLVVYISLPNGGWNHLEEIYKLQEDIPYNRRNSLDPTIYPYLAVAIIFMVFVIFLILPTDLIRPLISFKLLPWATCCPFLSIDQQKSLNMPQGSSNKFYNSLIIRGSKITNPRMDISKYKLQPRSISVN